ncbi:hypothetical protein BH10PSE7_BH10PSE7_39690 [soil metagenome]
MESEARTVLLKDVEGEEPLGVAERQRRLREIQADFAKYAAGHDLSVDTFLAERKAMWGED